MSDKRLEEKAHDEVIARYEAAIERPRAAVAACEKEGY